MIQGMFDHGALPTLERLVQFTGARHRVLTNNIANLSTPYFKPTDLSPQTFQQALGRALDRRRSQGANPVAGKLDLADTREMTFRRDRIDIRPQASHQGILYHDQNNRDLERTMQHLAENTLAHRVGVELMRNQFDMIGLAIRERI